MKDDKKSETPDPNKLVWVPGLGFTEYKYVAQFLPKRSE